MNPSEPKDAGFFPRRAKISAALACLFALLFLLAPGLNVPKPFSPAPSAFCVLPLNYAESLPEHVGMADFEPIFLPTKWNNSVPEPEITAKEPFAAPYKIESPEYAKESFRANLAGAGKFSPIAFSLSKRSVYASFMREDFSPKNADSDAGKAKFRVVGQSSETPVLSGTLDVKTRLGGALWRPVEISVIVGADGVMSPPLLTAHSGLESLDEELSSYVSNVISKRALKKGEYKITFAP